MSAENQANRGHERRASQVVSLSRADMDELVERIAEANAKSVSAAVEVLAEKMTNEDAVMRFWSAGYRALHQHATEHTGRWVLGGMAAVAQKLMLFLLLGGIVYAVGGWTALAKLWHAFFGGTP